MLNLGLAAGKYKKGSDNPAAHAKEHAAAAEYAKEQGNSKTPSSRSKDHGKSKGPMVKGKVK